MTPISAPARPYLGYLDSLRGVAALIIAVFWHYQHFSSRFQPGAPPFEASPLFDIEPFRSLYAWGYLSVDLFFMVSGVVLAHVYEDAIAARQVGWKRFAWLRFARLYPVHLLTLLVAAGLVWLFHADTHRFPVYTGNNAYFFMLNVLFLQGTPGLAPDYSFNGPAWSLSTEAAMYVLFFVVAASGRARLLAPVLVGLGLIGWLHGLDERFARGLVGFFGGVVICQTSGRSASGWVVLPLGFTLALCVFMGLLAAGVRPAVPGIDGKLTFAWLASALLIAAVLHWPTLQRRLDTRPLRLLGDLSLSLYMVHFPVQVAVLLVCERMRTPPPSDRAWFWGLVTLLELTAAWAVHRGFERPSRVWLRALPGRGRPHVAITR